MTQITKSILDAALLLSEAERAELVEKLLSTFHHEEASESPQEVERAWIAEAHRRAEAMDGGTSEELPGDEILAALKRGERP